MMWGPAPGPPAVAGAEPLRTKDGKVEKTVDSAHTRSNAMTPPQRWTRGPWNAENHPYCELRTAVVGAARES